MPASVDQPFLVLITRPGQRARCRPGADAPITSCFSNIPSTVAGRWRASGERRRCSRRPSPGARLMRLMGLEAIYQAPRDQRAAPRASDLSLSAAEPDARPPRSCVVRRHHLYPGAARVPVPGRDHGLGDAPCPGVAAVEHHGCQVLHRGVERGAGRDGGPEIFNTDQGSQFTSLELHRRAQGRQLAISMDGRGRCLDNIFIERLWRSLKYEAVYLHEMTDGFAAERVIGEWIEFHNTSGRIGS